MTYANKSAKELKVEREAAEAAAAAKAKASEPKKETTKDE